jgi:hypothetical protein
VVGDLANAGITVTSVAIDLGNKTTVGLNVNVASGITINRPYSFYTVTSAAYVGFTAEL